MSEPEPPRDPVVQHFADAPKHARRGPLLITDALEPAPLSPAEAPSPDGPDIAAEGATERGVRALARGGSTLSAVFWGAVAALVGLGLSVAAWDFVTGLLLRNPVLGGVASLLGGVVALGLLAFGLRELAATARLGRVDAIRDAVRAALDGTDHEAAASALRRLRRLYAGRADMQWALDRLRGREREVLDAPGLLAEVETTLLGPLDRLAESEVARAARSAAIVTALVPVTLVDVVAALTINLRMIRRVAEVYGGRAGWLGSWRLLKAVATHLVATGAVAMGDDLLGSVMGGGVVARLSRRFGEGLVNGALTARVGAAAIEVCRPMPFAARPRPSGRTLAARALASLADRAPARDDGLA